MHSDFDATLLGISMSGEDCAVRDEAIAVDRLQVVESERLIDQPRRPCVYVMYSKEHRRGKLGERTLSSSQR